MMSATTIAKARPRTGFISFSGNGWPESDLSDRPRDEVVDPLLEVFPQRFCPAPLVAALGLQRRKPIGLPVDGELVDALLFDVLQLLTTKVAKCCPAGEVIADEHARGFGQEDLPAVPGGADARRADDVEADVALVADGRLARVESHSHLDRVAVRPVVGSEGALRLNRAGDRISRPLEREEERVTLRVDLASADPAQGLAEDAPLLAQHLAVALPQAAHELG